MKNTCCAIVAIAILLSASKLFAQTDSTKKSKQRYNLTITVPGGVSIQKKDSAMSKAGAIRDKDPGQMGESKKDHVFKTGITIVDLGINVLKDNTNYANAAVKTFLHVPAARQNASLFDLRQGKSINVNVYPLMIRFKALHTSGQRIYLSSGLGLQLYNFRFEQPLTYTRNPTGVTVYDSSSFKKDKLAMDYLNVPLMFTFKTRLNKNNWLVYGGGLTEGYRLDSWTKQVIGSNKDKQHDAYGLADFNTCVSAEFGIEGMFRFYATYQLTSLYTNGLDQHPFSFGIRFTGI
jgi:hypothetical protein